jgi:hypothetical protein
VTRPCCWQQDFAVLRNAAGERRDDRRGPSKTVGKDFAAGRIRIARAYLKTAQDEATLAGEGDLGNPIVSQIATAAIAYADALTAQFGARVNRQYHAAAVKSLREALGNRLPSSQATQVRKILAEKDTAQYGIRIINRAEAGQLLRQLEEFAHWAEGELRRPR